MNKVCFLSVIGIVLIAFLVLRAVPPPLSVPELIGPGDKIGEMTVEQGVQVGARPELWYFCDFPPENPENRVA